jgi:hypothetical protein
MAVTVIVKVVMILSCHDSYGGSGGGDDNYYGCDSDSK